MNSFGRLFRLSVFGESHGESVGLLLDGVRPGISLDSSDFNTDIDRRRPKGIGGTPRKEADKAIIKSGVFNGKTTGAPLLIEFNNNNTISKDYSNLVKTPRPGHADFTFREKFHGYNDYRGGGATSGRLTLGLVSAGVIAKKMFPEIKYKTDIISIAGETCKSKFNDLIESISLAGDSVGGKIQVRVGNVAVGLGEPYFDSLESTISHLLFSIGAIKSVSFGHIDEKSLGSEYNDPIISKDGKTSTNNNGGINGGVSNGNEIIVTVFVKPTSSIFKTQNTFNFETNKVEEMNIKGRHDAAIILRAGVVVEAAVAIALCDATLVNKALYN